MVLVREATENSRIKSGRRGASIMPKREDIRRVLVLGSGPIVIGQAAEFDYSGTQACRALREEGIYVCLLNPNPATIMTDIGMADRTYIEPLTVESVRQIFEKEKIDGLIATMGGQAGLNLAVSLADCGLLEEYGVRLLGTDIAAIQKGEDRDLFKRPCRNWANRFLPAWWPQVWTKQVRLLRPSECLASSGRPSLSEGQAADSWTDWRILRSA